MKYDIIGEFNSGLKVYLKGQLIMYSEVDRSIWGDNINIYNNDYNLILKIKQYSSYFDIEENLDKVFFDLNKINKSSIVFKENNEIKFHSKWYSISLYPATKIYYKTKEIGEIKTKQLSLGINMSVNIKEFENEFSSYILVLILCKYSNVDHQ